ncbi:MAG: hypothetical protein JW881_06860 [Spirochaetales bacterium]|nr:hypothetical protein [Spirochaetales bacterium]
MVFIPDFRLGLLNGWIPFSVYLAVFGIIISCFSKEVRKRLYDRSLWTKKQIIVTTAGKLITFANLILICLSPIRFNCHVFIIGVALWTIGLTGLAAALIVYADTPPDSPVTGGVYRISRNPQIFSIWIIFTGTCFIIGSGVSFLLFVVSLVFLHQSVIAEEEACLKQYGNSYRKFMEKIPRYFLFF